MSLLILLEIKYSYCLTVNQLFKDIYLNWTSLNFILYEHKIGFIIKFYYNIIIQGVPERTYQKENCISLTILNQTRQLFFHWIEGHSKFCLVEKSFTSTVRTCHYSYWHKISDFQNIIKKLGNFVKNTFQCIFFYRLHSFSNSILWIIIVFDLLLERVHKKRYIEKYFWQNFQVFW